MHQQEPLLGDDLVETPFGYKGYVGDHWVMEETLPPASMEPNMDAVNRIKVQPDRLEVGDSFRAWRLFWDHNLFSENIHLIFPDKMVAKKACIQCVVSEYFIQTLLDPLIQIEYCFVRENL